MGAVALDAGDGGGIAVDMCEARLSGQFIKSVLKAQKRVTVERERIPWQKDASGSPGRSARWTSVIISAAVDALRPNSCCTRPTTKLVVGAAGTRDRVPDARSNVVACSASVTALRTPIDVFDGKRPVNLAAPRIVLVRG